MQGRITLITPPDFYENSNFSLLFVNITEEEQDAVSHWLGSKEFTQDLNIYVYDGDTNASWFLYAANRCEYKYINMDHVNFITQTLGGYILGKSGVYYRTDDVNLGGVLSHINNNRVESVEIFLESILGDQTDNTQTL
jgi:hypothetical protein